MNCEEKWKNCQEFDDLTWIEHQFIQFIKIGERIELQINQEGIESLVQNICKLSKTRKNRILYLGNANWGNGKFVNYTPFWYLDENSIKVTFVKLFGKAEILRAEYLEAEKGKKKEIYFEGTRSGLEKLIRVLVNTKNNNQQIEISSAYNKDSPFLLNTLLVNYKGRMH